MNRKTLSLAAALVVVSLLASGCVAALVVGAAGGAGGYRWSSGKLSFETSHSITTCHDAVIKALAGLKIKVTDDSSDMLSGKIKGVTGTGDEVRIDIEPQSATVTKLDVRVGFWGNKTRSEMIADAIKKNLR
jgi:hypothetical protein